MKSIKLKQRKKMSVSFYLSLEEYLLNNSNDEYFFLWDINPSIVVGRHQLIATEVNERFAKENNIPIYRRHSGGGTIYADTECFMFSFITRENNKDLVFSKYLNLLLDKLKLLGLDVSLSGRNDLIFKNKKFSGCSIYKNSNGIVLHGTFLYNTNLDNLMNAICVDNDKLISKGISSVRERVINLKDYLKMSLEDTKEYLLTMNKDIIILDDDIMKIVEENEKKYLFNDWIKGNNPLYSYKESKRFAWGKITVLINVKKEEVYDMSFNGDFITVNDINDFYNKFKSHKYNKEEFIIILNDNSINEYILNSNNEDFISICFGGENE